MRHEKQGGRPDEGRYWEGMRFLSIDPGATTGWALFDSGTLLDCGACDYDEVPGMHHIERILLELPQVYPRDPVDPNNLITLAYRAGYVVGPLAALGAPVTMVLPREWKGQTPKDICHARAKAKRSPKEQAIVDAASKGRRKLDDMLDAVALGQYAVAVLGWR